jgi:uncharacterized protein YecE (DUF72 family)
MTRLLFGLPRLTGKIDNYAKRFDLVEVRPVDGPLPKPGRLAKWRADVPPAFAFSVVLPKAVTLLQDGADDALAVALKTATALQARAMVLTTPASVRPTARNRRRLAELAARLPDTGVHRVWEPLGMWEPEDVLATAHEAGLLACFDAAQGALPGGPVAYTRIRAVGSASNLGTQRIQRIAEQVRGRREAFIVVDALVAKKVRAGIAALLADDPNRRPIPTLFTPDMGLDLDLDDEEQ